jgi:hypothetical protein
MRDAMGFRLRLAAFAFLLPLALAVAAHAEDAQPAEQPAATPATPQKPPDPASAVPRGITGVILSITGESLAVRTLAQGAGGGRSFLTLAGGADTPVSGTKSSFKALEMGDLVAVSYQGDPPKALGIRVLPRELDPTFAAATGADRYAKRGREFIGWIKKIDDKTMVVRTPSPPKGSKHKAEVKTFVRTDTTQVELLRNSWDEMKKGDRVAVTFAKGEPRPAETVKVVLIGGQKPLPPGLATQLFDPAYDKSVQDVDGIGEWPPDKEWPSGKPKAAAPAPTQTQPAGAEGARSDAKPSEVQPAK